MANFYLVKEAGEGDECLGRAVRISGQRKVKSKVADKGPIA